MARIKYSALVDSIRGSIAGTTFQSNSYGYTVKAKPNVSRPSSVYQVQQQILFGLAVRSWRALSGTNRANWNTWASTYPQYSKFNPAAELSGFAIFVKVHVYRFMAGLSVQSNPVVSEYAPDTFSLGIAETGTTLDVYFYSTTEDENWYVLFSVSRYFPPSTNFIGSKCRFFGSATNTDRVIDIKTAYIEKFGSIPAGGDKIALSYVMIGKDNGQVISPVKTLTNVGA